MTFAKRLRSSVELLISAICKRDQHVVFCQSRRALSNEPLITKSEKPQLRTDRPDSARTCRKKVGNLSRFLLQPPICLCLGPRTLSICAFAEDRQAPEAAQRKTKLLRTPSSWRLFTNILTY